MLHLWKYSDNAGMVTCSKLPDGSCYLYELGGCIHAVRKLEILVKSGTSEGAHHTPCSGHVI